MLFFATSLLKRRKLVINFIGSTSIAQFSLSAHVHCLHADATLSTTYQSMAPADVLIVCGVFGNVRASDTASSH